MWKHLDAPYNVEKSVEKTRNEEEKEEEDRETKGTRIAKKKGLNSRVTTHFRRVRSASGGAGRGKRERQKERKEEDEPRGISPGP